MARKVGIALIAPHPEPKHDSVDSARRLEGHGGQSLLGHTDTLTTGSPQEITLLVLVKTSLPSVNTRSPGVSWASGGEVSLARQAVPPQKRTEEGLCSNVPLSR